MKVTFALTGFALAAAAFASNGNDDTPCPSSCSAKPKASLAANAVDDIVTTAVKAGSFETLATALKTAELIEALQGEGPFTVFAPTDAAFAKLPEGTVASLLEEKNRDLLTGILTYHVVEGQITPDEISGMQTTLNGADVDVTGSDDELMVNGANVVCGGVETANATVYLIDQVLIPEE